MSKIPVTQQSVEWLINAGKQYNRPVDCKRSDNQLYKVIRLRSLSTVIWPVKDRERDTYTIESIKAFVSENNFLSRSDFQLAAPAMYRAARAFKLIEELFPISKKFKYTKEQLINISKNYKTRVEFENSHPAYQVVNNRKLMDEIGPPKIGATSVAEKELLAFLQSLVADFEPKRFANDYALDCYSDSLKLGVEYNGFYWHSEENKGKQYHLKKTEYFKAKGIRIIHIWQDEWSDRQLQVKNYLSSACKINKRIGARKCTVMPIEAAVARQFLNNNHIQGKPVSVLLALGCFYNNELIAVTTYGLHHRNNSSIVLNRFACAATYTVTGLLSKMSKMAYTYFKQPIISWADYCKSEGTGYIAAGWRLVGRLPPDYFYVNHKTEKKVSKQSRRKSKMQTPQNMTEYEHAKADGLLRIWDCGKLSLIYEAP